MERHFKKKSTGVQRAVQRRRNRVLVGITVAVRRKCLYIFNTFPSRGSSVARWTVVILTPRYAREMYFAPVRALARILPGTDQGRCGVMCGLGPFLNRDVLYSWNRTHINTIDDKTISKTFQQKKFKKVSYNQLRVIIFNKITLQNIRANFEANAYQ